MKPQMFRMALLVNRRVRKGAETVDRQAVTSLFREARRRKSKIERMLPDGRMVHAGGVMILAYPLIVHH